MRLHSHYGYMEILGAYAPVHSHAETLTYRANISTTVWEKFYTRDEDMGFLENYEPSQILIDPQNEKSMIELQQRIERHEGPFFLSALEISQKKLREPLQVYRPKKMF